MNTKILILGMALFGSVSAHAQTAGDVDTQIRVTHDVVGQVLRGLKTGSAEATTLRVSDYQKWKADFDQRVETEMSAFEQSVNEQLLPSMNAAVQPLLRVKSATGITESQKDSLVDQESARFLRNSSFNQIYKQAIQSVYDHLFPGLPMGISTGYIDVKIDTWFTSSNMGSSQFYPDNEVVADRERVHYYAADGSELFSVRNNNLYGYSWDTSRPEAIYGYEKGIYPYIRKSCQTRACVTFVSQKLAEAVSLVRNLIDIPRSVQIAGMTVNLAPLINCKQQYEDKCRRLSQINLYTDISWLRKSQLNDDYSTLPLEMPQ